MGLFRIQSLGFRVSIRMFKKITLSNGLRILTAPMHGTNTVTALVVCGTGSDFEAREERGISHFLEHMFFKGTASRPSAGGIRNELDQMGSESNAFTSHETTGYYIKAGKSHAERAIKILADIYKNSLLSADEINRERQVIVEELNMRRDNPQSYIGWMWERILYGDQPAGWEPVGILETLGRFQREDLVRYFLHQYVSGNTMIVMAGSLDEEVMRRLAADEFSDIREDKPRPKPAVIEPQSAPALLVEERKTDQTHLIIGFRAHGVPHPRRYAIDLLATVLGGNWSSRMFAEIRDRLGLAYAIGSSNTTYTNRGYIETYAGVAHGNVEKAIAAILGEYRRIREEAVKGEDLARALDFLKGRTLMDLETSDAVASFVAGEEMLTGQPLTIEEVFAKLEAVTIADVQAAARELFRPERLNAVVLGPLGESNGRIQSLLESFV